MGEFVQQHARRPTSEETAVACGLPFEEADAVLRWGRQPRSLSEPARNYDDCPLAEFVCAPNGDPAKHVDYALDCEILKKSIADALRLLDDRERAVIRLRFGLSNGQPRTLRDVGKVLSTSYETVRRIEARALTKLQTPALESLASIW
jgi:RNA polymerase primary sigma factor